MNQPHQPQQITPEQLSEMLVNALMRGNEPLHQEILIQSKRISELEYSNRNMSQNLAAFLSELKATLSEEKSGTGLKKTLNNLTTALNNLSAQQAQLLSSIEALSTQLERAEMSSASRRGVERPKLKQAR